MSSYEQEYQEYQRWKLKPGWEGYAGFEHLIANEFRSVQEHQRQTDRQVRKIVQFSATHVPFYRDIFATLPVKPADIRGLADLHHLPVLSKRCIQSHSESLLSRHIPEGHEIRWVGKTSGTTGEPLKIPRSRMTGIFMMLSKHRQLRWMRCDPMKLLAQVRPAIDLPRNGKGRMLQTGETCHQRAWPLVGPAFHTGRFIGFGDGNAVDSKIAWLDAHRPDYLLGQSAQLEQLALAAKDVTCNFSLQWIEGISQQMTPEMEGLIESVFEAPVFLNYGLNEVGLVAARCPEGGQYHIHSEHCAIEIVDDQGAACKPGERGRLLVTAFGNLAMPLIRYDTDDIAEVSRAPCSCGRTLPTFREIHGRYRRTALLPPGTWDYWRRFQRCLGTMTLQEQVNLRQYQLHHHRDGSFTLNIARSGELHADFLHKIKAAWSDSTDPNPAPLTINFVSVIARPAGGKFQSFVSDLFPDQDRNAGP